MKKLFALALATIMAITVVGCGDDDPAKPKETPETSDYKPLTEPWHVLHNLEQAYDDKNIDRYSEIFDPANFVFFFNAGDVGGSVPVQWGYAEEIASATHMFRSAGGIENNPILTIDVTLFNVETAQWVDTTLPQFPGEILRMVTVVYDYFIDTAQDRQFITAGNPTAQFVVRNVDGTWKLVQWFDLYNTRARAVSGSVEESTWGKVKALYQ